MKNIKYASMEDIDNISISLDFKKSGIPFIVNGEERVLKNDYHTLVIGEDDIQKDSRVIAPLIDCISQVGESFMVNDRSGSLFNKFNNLLKDKNYNVVCINLDNPSCGSYFNIFDLPYKLYKNNNKDKALEILEDIGFYLLYENGEKGSDPFWINSATNFFVGCVLYLFENGLEVDLNKVYELSGKISKEDIKPNTTIYTYLSGTLNAPNETKSSIISVFNQKINKYVSRENLCNMLSKSSVDLENLKSEKTAIFIVEGTSGIASNLVSLVVSQIYYSLNIYGNSSKFNIILSSFDDIVPIKNICNIISLGSSFNINFIVFIKNFLSLNNLYGRENGEMLKIYFKNIIYLYSNDVETLEYISKLIGNDDSISSLRNLKDNEALFIIIRVLPFIVNLCE